MNKKIKIEVKPGYSMILKPLNINKKNLNNSETVLSEINDIILY